MTLTELAHKHSTDKGSHGYTPIYDRLFTPQRQSAIRLLEIGVQFGNSLDMWEEYFPNAQIVGADIVDNGMKAKYAENERVHFTMSDQSMIEDMRRFAVDYGPFDIIIDDGNHVGLSIVNSLLELTPYLLSGGYYCIEDLHAHECQGFEPWITLMNMIREDINRREPDQCGDGFRSDSVWESVTFYRSLVILKRK